MIVVIPPELESKLRQVAQQNGVAPEEYALERVREALNLSKTLFDAWQDVIGRVEGNGEANSENTSERFGQAMVEKKRTGHL